MLYLEKGKNGVYSRTTTKWLMEWLFSSLNYGKKIDPREKSNYYFCRHFSGDREVYVNLSLLRLIRRFLKISTCWPGWGRKEWDKDEWSAMRAEQRTVGGENMSDAPRTTSPKEGLIWSDLGWWVLFTRDQSSCSRSFSPCSGKKGLADFHTSTTYFHTSAKSLNV